MTAPRLKPQELPDWPRWMCARKAAAYVDAPSVKAFLEEVSKGIWPEADPERNRWDKKRLDDESDKRSGLGLVGAKERMREALKDEHAENTLPN